MRRIAYLGAFGVGNRGDDYLAYVFAQNYPASLFVGFAPPHFDVVTPFLTFDQMASLTSFDVDVVTICGGNFIWSVHQLQVILAIARAVKADGKMFNIRSVHVSRETVCLDTASFTELALLADEFTVRDSFSVSLCRDFGIQSVYERDPLGEFIEENNSYSKALESHELYVGCNFHNHGDESIDWYFEYLATINHFSKRPLNLIYIIQCRHLTHWQSNEAIIAEMLFTRFGGRIKITSVDVSLSELLSSFRKLDLMLTNRTHGIIIANALGIQTIPSGIVDEKSHAQARDLGLPVVHLNENPHEAGRRVEALINGSQTLIPT